MTRHPFKSIFNKSLISALALIIALVFIVPVPASAGLFDWSFFKHRQTDTEQKPKNEDKPQTENEEINTATSSPDFCLNLDSSQSELNQKIKNKQAQISAKAAQRLMDVTAIREERQNQLENLRQKAQARLNQRLSELDASAATEKQKQAILDFKSAVTAAAQIRQSRIDQAIKNFQTGLDASAGKNQSLLRKALINYQSAVTAAEDENQSSCQSQKTGDALARLTFNQKMQAAKAAFDAGAYAQTLQDDIDAFSRQRDEIIITANNDFTLRVEQAAQKLKTELK